MEARLLFIFLISALMLSQEIWLIQDGVLQVCSDLGSTMSISATNESLTYGSKTICACKASESRYLKLELCVMHMR